MYDVRGRWLGGRGHESVGKGGKKRNTRDAPKGGNRKQPGKWRSRSLKIAAQHVIPGGWKRKSGTGGMGTVDVTPGWALL